MICTKPFLHFHICMFQPCLIERTRREDLPSPLLLLLPVAQSRALVELQRRGILKCLVSQNCDGLHLRSGMNPACLAELHGNMNLEKCSKCEAKYLRDFDASHGRMDHLTGRQCDKPSCKGPLKDSIIHFGENLPDDELEKAFRHAEKADVCLVLGKHSMCRSLVLSCLFVKVRV